MFYEIIILCVEESTESLSQSFFRQSPGRIEIEDYSEMKKGQMFEFAHVPLPRDVMVVRVWA